MTSDTPGFADRIRLQLGRFLSWSPAARFLGLFAFSSALVVLWALFALWVPLVATLATLSGLGVVVLLIGLVNTTLAEKLHDVRKGKSRVLAHGHTLILGSGEKLYAILEELKEANATVPGAVVVVLAAQHKEEVETSIRERLGDLKPTRLEVRQGSPFLVSDLQKVGAGRARSIIVLSPEDPERRRAGADELAAIKTLLALRRVPGALADNYAVVELPDDSRRAVVERLGGGGIELVTVSDTLSRLMVKMSRQRGLAQVYRALLSFKGSEFHFKDIPQLIGRPFGKAQWHVDGAVVCGVRKKAGKLLLNPPDELVLERGDELLVVAENGDSTTLVPAKKPPVPAGFSGASAVARRPERFLVCGRSPKLAEVLRALDQAVLPGSEAWLMLGWTKEAYSEFLRGELGTQKNLRFSHVEGDPTLAEDLAKVVAPGFGVVMAMADTSRDQEEADARTVITVLLLRDLFGQLESPPPRIISEVLDPRTKELLEQERGADFVVSHELTSMLLAQISQRRELNLVFKSLFDSGGNELYLKRSACFATAGQPTPWPVIQKVARQRKEVAIGYFLEGAAPVLNPPKASVVTFAEGDRVIVLATDDSEAREDVRGGVLGPPLAPVSQTRTRSALLPPLVVEEPSLVTAGPRVKGPSNEPRTPLPSKPKV